MKVSVLAVVSLAVILMFGGVASSSVAENKKNISAEEAEKKAIEHLEKGLTFDEQGEYDKAIAEYNKTLEYYPGAENALFNLGWIYIKTDKMPTAITTFEKLVELSPDYYEAFNLLGVAYNEVGKKREAVKAWKTSLNLQADQPEIKKSCDKLDAALAEGSK